MAIPVLIFDFDSSSVVAGVFTMGRGTGRGDLAGEYFSATTKNGLRSALASLFNELRSKGFKGCSHAIVGLPPASISLRVITLPFSDKKKLDEILPFEARDIFLKGVEELSLSALPLSDGKVLVASVEKSLLREYLDAFKEFDIDPSFIGSSIFSKDRILKKLYDGGGAGAFLDSNSLVVIKEDLKPCFFKEIKGVQDLTLALKALEEEGVTVRKFYSTPKATALLKSIGIESSTFNEYPEEKTGLTALAAHFREGTLKEGINWRSGEFALTRGIKAAEKGFQRAALLLGIFVIIFGAYSYLKYERAKAALGELKKRMDSEYRELFPGERIVDASYQLDAKLKELSAEKRVLSDGMNVPEVMAELSRAVPPHGEARIYNLRMEAGRITANGYTGSFEGANNFKDAISKLPYFKDITLTDVKTRAGGGVSFSLSAAVREAS